MNRATRQVLSLALGLVVCGISSRAAEGTLAIAAASDLRFALDEIITAFKTNHPNATIRTTYGSSGNFYAQLSQRAPFDIFFSADVSYPARLIEGGFGVASSKFTYAVGRIVVWVPTNSPIDPASLGIESLKHPSVRKIAIANPAHAPYGRAAVAAMEKLGVYDTVKSKLVLGENIAQTAQFVETGGADVGIIALSLAVAPAAKEKGRYWEFPLDAYPRVEQGGMITPWAQDPALAQEFRSFVLGESGKSVLRRYGFFMPNKRQ
jgi:molybdate transport system substrate-binding protein